MPKLITTVKFKDGAQAVTAHPGLTWATAGPSLFADDIAQAQAAHGGEDHAGAWMEHETGEGP